MPWRRFEVNPAHMWTPETLGLKYVLCECFEKSSVGRLHLVFNDEQGRWVSSNPAGSGYRMTARRFFLLQPGRGTSKLYKNYKTYPTNRKNGVSLNLLMNIGDDCPKWERWFRTTCTVQHWIFLVVDLNRWWKDSSFSWLTISSLVQWLVICSSLVVPACRIHCRILSLSCSACPSSCPASLKQQSLLCCLLVFAGLRVAGLHVNCWVFSAIRHSFFSALHHVLPSKLEAHLKRIVHGATSQRHWCLANPGGSFSPSASGEAWVLCP